MSPVLSIPVPVESLTRPLPAFVRVPLQTGPTTLHVLGLLVGLPLLVILAITLLVRWSSLARPVSGTPGVFAEPVWVGPGGTEQGADAGEEGAPDRPALEAAPDATVAPVTGTDPRGGASVRW